MPKLDFNFKFEGSLFKIVLSVLIPIMLFIAIGFMCSRAFSAELNQIPEGYKVVKNEAVCTEPSDPCQKLTDENKKLKNDLDHYKARSKLLESEIEDLKNDLAKKPKTETIIKYIKESCPMPPEPKTIEKTVEKTVEKVVMPRNIFRVMGALSQDGIETHASPNDPYAVDAYTYTSGIGGAGYTRFLNDSFGIGVFGMLGGINKTLGISGEVAF